MAPRWFSSAWCLVRSLCSLTQSCRGTRTDGAGGCAGAVFIQASQQFLERFEDVKFESLQGASARKTVLVVGIMAAHALGEGSGVGVSFCGQRGWAQVLIRASSVCWCCPRCAWLALMSISK